MIPKRGSIKNYAKVVVVIRVIKVTYTTLGASHVIEQLAGADALIGAAPSWTPRRHAMRSLQGEGGPGNGGADPVK